MWDYKLIQNRSEFGIALLYCGKEKQRIEQISSCRAEVERLAELLNEEQVEPCHFEDVIEDYFTDFTI